MSSITPKPYYFLGLVIPLSVIVGNYYGNFYVGTSTFLGLVVFPLIDLIWGEGEDVDLCIWSLLNNFSFPTDSHNFGLAK